MNNLSYTSAEEAITRYCLALFRMRVNSAGSNVNMILNDCIETARTEQNVYAQFKKKYPLLPHPSDMRARNELIDRMIPMISQRAEKDGRKLIKNQIVRDMGETTVRSFFHNSGMRFRIRQNKGKLNLELKLSETNEMSCYLDYKHLHDSGFLEGILQDARTISAICVKYDDSIHLIEIDHSRFWES